MATVPLPKLDEILGRFGMSGPSLDRPCSHEHAVTIALKITSWKSLSPFLGLSDLDDADIDDCKSVRERNIKMMRIWLHQGQIATYLRLAMVFMQVERHDLVERLCEIIQQSEGPGPNMPQRTTGAPEPCAPGTIISDEPSLSKIQKFVGQSGKTYRILAKISPKWNRLAIALGLEEDIDSVRMNTHHQVEDACLEILRRWLDGGGRKPVTWSTFIECLDDIQLGTLAEELTSEFAV